jgi:serine/threonine-protein kinase RsbW
MTANATDTSGECLTLSSSLSDLGLVPPWIGRLAAPYAIPEDTRFAMDLCLEEVLSNVIRHGYAGEPGRHIFVQFSNLRKGYFILVVEDEAPRFDPLSVPEPPGSVDEAQAGGNGIRLLRRFADTLQHQATPTGNRLTIGFAAGESPVNSTASAR